MKKTISLLLASVILIIMLCMPASATMFTDYSEHNYFYEAVQNLVSASVISGYPDGSFKPDNNLTRAEAAVIMCRLDGYFDLIPAKTTYTDVTSSYDWASGYIKKATELNIIQGDMQKRKYMPGNNLTGEQFITMLVRWTGYGTKADARSEKWPQNYIAVANEIGLFDYWRETYDKHIGWVRGDTEVVLQKTLSENLSRETACAFAYTAKKLKIEKPTIENPESENAVNKVADSLLAKLYKAFQTNDKALVKSIIDSSEFAELANKIGDGYSYIYFPNENPAKTGKGMAAYFVDYPQNANLEAYGNLFVYYGDFVNGVRHGNGEWVAAKNNHYYWVSSGWQKDVPNGTFSIEEWNEFRKNDDGSYRTRMLSGNVTNGLFNGNISWTFKTGSSVDTYIIKFNNGNARTEDHSEETQDNRTPYYILAESGRTRGLRSPVDFNTIKFGILGFDQVGSKSLVY